MIPRFRANSVYLRSALAGFLLLLSLHSFAHEEEETLTLAAGQSHYTLAPILHYIADPEHRIDIDAARKAHADGLFQHATESGDVNFGYSASAFWLSFKVAIPQDAPPNWLLEISFPSLDNLEVYVPGEAGAGYKRLEAGDLQPFAARPFPHRNFVFPLELKAGTTKTVFVRVVSQGSLTLPMRLWQRDAFVSAEQESYAWLSVYFGMLLALLLYNLLLYLSIRDRVFLAYVAFVFCMALGQASFNGFGNQFFWPTWPRWGNVALPSCMAATGFFGALFTRLFLNTRQNLPRWDRVLLALAIAFALIALSPAFMPYRIAAIATSLCGLVFSAITVVVGFHSLMRGHPGARYFLVAWSMFLVGVGTLAMRNLSWLPTNWFTTHAMLIGSAAEMLLLSFALADRINFMRHEKDRAQLQVLTTHQTMLEALQHSEQELEARVEERTRALAEANARLLESEQQLQHMVYHDPLTGLANRVLLYDRISHALAQSNRHGSLLAVLMLDLDGFKLVNDRYGHDVGDQLLAAVANRLRATLREADTVARFGGDEFVIALETVHHLQDAVVVTTKLLTELERPFMLGDRELNLSASIGVAMYPDHGADANTLIKQADEAMYRAKQAGRNAYRLAGA
ncbi:MAG TPA: 7TM diverse intracellular signaling domain-containing protein [Burkholderiales bacterium]|nr:7TM diverse intracellular signaling domain-containing protein [Burkholderiales bacterium]